LTSNTAGRFGAERRRLVADIRNDDRPPTVSGRMMSSGRPVDWV
jgi:hypothetical protein